MPRLSVALLILLAACHKTADVVPPGQDGGPDAGPVTARQWPPDRTGYVNPIPTENAQAGDADWQSFSTSWNHQVEGYADRVSASVGDSVNVMASSDAAKSASWQLYRLGWYGGAGARKLAEGTTSLAKQAACPEDTSTGMIRCAWTPTFSVTVPQGAVSGLYVIRVKRSDTYATMIPLVVKDARKSDLLFQASVTTYQAYNQWGGESLYTDDDGIAGHKAVMVSFDRPYGSYQGTSDMLRWEVHMARFLERNGYDVTYTTNLDVVKAGVQLLKDHGGFLSVAHDEYWPGAERGIVDDARDSGVPIFFFGANPAYWKVRTSDPGADGLPRTITCYKQYPATDPLAGQAEATGRFRDAPFNNPEEKLVGVMYESWVLFGHPWVVSQSSHALYAGTGLSDGDTLSQLVGYEYDRTFDNDTPSPTTVLSHAPVVDAEGKPGYAEATLYTAPSGALVFGAGTIYWSLGLDGDQRDPRVERMTANLFQLALKLPVPASLQSVSAPSQPQPVAAWGTDVRTLGKGLEGPAGVAQLPDGSVVIADSRAHRIFRMDSAGNVAPYAGDGNPSGDSHYDNVPALKARFFQPTAVQTDAEGNVYVADTHNCAIRKIGTDANHTVTTVAGLLFGCDYRDGTGSAARFSNPMGLAWQGATKLLIADSANHAIRALDVTTGAVTTVAIGHGGDETDGPIASAIFFFPTAVAAADDGRIFFVTSSTGKLKVISGGNVTTLVAGGLGFADGAGTSAKLLPQGGLAWDGTGLIVADSGNQRLRRVVPGATAAATQVSTFAGSGRVGPGDGSASAAQFGLPLGLFRAPSGTLYLADGAGSIRVVRP